MGSYRRVLSDRSFQVKTSRGRYRKIRIDSLSLIHKINITDFSITNFRSFTESCETNVRPSVRCYMAGTPIISSDWIVVIGIIVLFIICFFVLYCSTNENLERPKRLNRPVPVPHVPGPPCAHAPRISDPHVPRSGRAS